MQLYTIFTGKSISNKCKNLEVLETVRENEYLSKNGVKKVFHRGVENSQDLSFARSIIKYKAIKCQPFFTTKSIYLHTKSTILETSHS